MVLIIVIFLLLLLLIGIIWFHLNMKKKGEQKSLAKVAKNLDKLGGKYAGWSIIEQDENNSTVHFSLDELKKKTKPVIIIPGLGGSIIHDKWNYGKESRKRLKKEIGRYARECKKKNDWEKSWVTVLGAMPDNLGASCWRYRFTPDYESGKGFVNRPDIQSDAWIEPPIDKDGNLNISDYFGGTEGIDILLSIRDRKVNIKMAYMFHLLLKDLKSRGFKSKENLFGAPYDFRRITSKYYSDNYFKALKLLIEHAVQKNEEKCIMIAHSLGCLVSKQFLSEYLPKVLGEQGAQDWKNKNIDLWMPIGSPIGGSGKGLRTCISGDDEGMGALCKLKGGCNDWYQKMEKYLSGLIWVLPDKYIFSGMNLLPGSGFNVNDVSELKKVLKQANAETAGIAFEEEVVPSYRFAYEPPGVKTYAICGNKVDTELAYEYTEITKSTGDPKNIYKEQSVYKNMKKLTDAQREIMNNVNINDMKGDGTVPWITLHMPKIWMKNGSKPNIFNGTYFDVRIKDFIGPNMDHKGMLDLPEVRFHIIDIILNS